MIMPLEWWMEKAFIIFLILLMGRMMQVAARQFVMWAFAYLSAQMKAGNMPGMKPSIKNAAGVIAMTVAPGLGQILLKKLEAWAAGGNPPNG